MTAFWMGFTMGGLALSVFWLLLVILSKRFRDWGQQVDDQIDDETWIENNKQRIKDAVDSV